MKRSVSAWRRRAWSSWRCANVEGQRYKNIAMMQGRAGRRKRWSAWVAHRPSQRCQQVMPANASDATRLGVAHRCPAICNGSLTTNRRRLCSTVFGFTWNSFSTSQICDLLHQLATAQHAGPVIATQAGIQIWPRCATPIIADRLEGQQLTHDPLVRRSTVARHGARGARRRHRFPQSAQPRPRILIHLCRVPYPGPDLSEDR